MGKYLFLFVVILLSLVFVNKVPEKKQETIEEITQIKTTNDLDQQVVLYKKLIERVGPEKAQEELIKSGLPFDGQTHLLNHTVGDWLYEKYGTNGLIHCRDYFLSSCYHGFVIHAVGAGGLDLLQKVMESCWQAGPHVAIQCSHAIGHGLLAWVGYDNLIYALEQCDKLASLSVNFPLYNCHDGVFMENIWAVHETGKPSKDRWVSDSDPIYPCDEKRIPEKYINACWSNQPMRMYQIFRGDVAKVGQQCLKLTNKIYQRTCFDGLARQIHPLTKGSAEQTFRLCSLMPKDWIDPCIISIVKAEFGVGGREIPFILCERVNANSRSACYNGLAEIIKSYTTNNKTERQNLCLKLPDQTIQSSCLN